MLPSDWGFGTLPPWIRRKLIMATLLTCLFPLLVLLYAVKKVFGGIAWLGPAEFSILSVTCLFIAVFFLAVTGFSLVREMGRPPREASLEERSLPPAMEGPGGAGTREMERTLNELVQRARTNMAQLLVYGEQARFLSLDINRRVLALSYFLQTSNLIAKGANFSEVLNFTLEKLTQSGEMDLNCFLEPTEDGKTFLVRAVNCKDQGQTQTLCGSRWEAPWLRELLGHQEAFVLNGQAASSAKRQSLFELTRMSSGVFQPIGAMGKTKGILLSARDGDPNSIFGKDTLNLLKLFGADLSIALENELMGER